MVSSFRRIIQSPSVWISASMTCLFSAAADVSKSARLSNSSSLTSSASTHPLGSGSGGGDAMCAKIMSMVRVGMALTLCSEASVSNGGLKSRGETNCRSIFSAMCSSGWWKRVRDPSSVQMSRVRSEFVVFIISFMVVGVIGLLCKLLFEFLLGLQPVIQRHPHHAAMRGVNLLGAFTNLFKVARQLGTVNDGRIHI